MFTGIIEEVGTLTDIKREKEAIQMKILAPKIIEDINLGDSIAINGVCLTVTSFGDNWFTVDLMPETVRATSLSQCIQGSKVNLERAMRADSRFGGHIVSGHVDGTAEIISMKPVDNAIYVDLSIDNDLAHYMVYKGSVTVDGTSLTIFGLEDQKLTLSLIPHTHTHTIFSDRKPGDLVNIEIDMMAKYIDKYLHEFKPDTNKPF